MGKMLFLLFSESFENELDALSLWIYTPHSRAHTHTRTCGHIGHWTQIQITHICMSNRMKEKMIFLLAASNDTHIHTHTPIHAYSRTEHKSISFSFFFSSCNSLLKFLLWDTFEKYVWFFFYQLKFGQNERKCLNFVFFSVNEFSAFGVRGIFFFLLTLICLLRKSISLIFGIVFDMTMKNLLINK